MKSLLLKSSLLHLSLFLSCAHTQTQNSYVLKPDYDLVHLDKKQYAPGQWQRMQRLAPMAKDKLRIMTFNLLFDKFDADLEEKYRWPNRLPHVLETIEKVAPDVFAVQESQLTQTNDLKAALSSSYEFISSNQKLREYDPKENLDDGIFYSKDRLELLHSEIFFVSSTPKNASMHPGLKFPKTVQMARFKDKRSGKIFGVISTHMDFFSTSTREFTAGLLCRISEELFAQEPIIALGDFNLFPHRPSMNYPFYDNDYIEEKFAQTCSLRNTRRLAAFGHLGPLGTFSNNEQDVRKPFSGLGIPGVELDQIYVRGPLEVLSHVTHAEIFPKDEYASDHFPVFVDIVLK